MSLTSPGDLTAHIVDTVNDATTAPTARLAAADTVVAGARTVLSGLASTYSGDGVTFAFDADGDGTPDQSGQDATAAHVYRTPGPVTASLTVTDDRGRTSTRAVRITVRAENSLRDMASVPPLSGMPVVVPLLAGGVVLAVSCTVLFLAIRLRRRG